VAEREKGDKEGSGVEGYQKRKQNIISWVHTNGKRGKVFALRIKRG